MAEVVVAIPMEPEECCNYTEIEIEEHHHEGEDVQYFLSARGSGLKFDITSLLIKKVPTLLPDEPIDHVQ